MRTPEGLSGAGATLPDGRRVSWEEAAAYAKAWREAADRLEVELVASGRAVGASWDFLGQSLGVIPNTLRRRYGS